VAYVRSGARGGTREGLTTVVWETKSSLGLDLSKYWALIYKQAGAWATITKVGSSGQEGAVCII